MADSRAKREWDAANTVMVSAKLNRRTDADILQKLESVPNKATYIKALIRQDIEKARKYPS